LAPLKTHCFHKASTAGSNCCRRSSIVSALLLARLRSNRVRTSLHGMSGNQVRVRCEGKEVRSAWLPDTACVHQRSVTTGMHILREGLQEARAPVQDQNPHVAQVSGSHKRHSPQDLWELHISGASLKPNSVKQSAAQRKKLFKSSIAARQQRQEAAGGWCSRWHALLPP